jgi:hypothetical protein
MMYGLRAGHQERLGVAHSSPVKQGAYLASHLRDLPGLEIAKVLRL